MPDSDFRGTIERLPERVQERLKLGAPERFVLLFALFNAMFCILIVLLLQIRQQGNYIKIIGADATKAVEQAAVQIDVLENEVDVLEDTVVTLEDKIVELLFPTHTPTIVSPTAASNPPTSAPTATLLPTPVPSPTATPVPPSPTSTPIPPTSTPEPTPTPKPKPKPESKPAPTRPPDPPPPTRPPDAPPPTRPPDATSTF